MMTKRPIMFTGLMLAGMALLVAMAMVLQTPRQSAKVQRASGSVAQVDPAKLTSTPASVATLATTAKPAQASWNIFRGDPALRGWAGAGELKLPLKLAWTFKTDGPVKSSPIVVDGKIYIGSHDGKVYALEADNGKRLWSFATGDVIEAPPLFAQGVVYIGSADGSMYALDA
ncbi:MAG: PQQ-like beta-propeller repeat protein [Phycisphaerales bacterium]|nr:PQQ-like beta-propeller repeat protein [Phycisphaerales bacterium]